MTDEFLCDFHSLPGVKGGRLKGPMARTVSGFRRALTAHPACSGAGDHGAVMVWRDDEGSWRCAFMRYQVTLQSAVLTSKQSVSEWLREWLPRMQEDADVRS